MHEPVEPAGDDRLDSWKAIAAFLDRDVSTVRRWEKTEGLPVHRHRHAARGSAYAFKAELRQWIESRRSGLEAHNTDGPIIIEDTEDPGSPAVPLADAWVGDTPSHRSRLGLGPYVVIGLAVLAASAGVAVYLRDKAPATSTFGPREWVLIGTIENRTGDPQLDDTLEYALEHELTESRVVNVVPRERIDDTLRLMKKPLDIRLDRAIGLEVCLRDGGIRALATGRVEKVGGTYALSMFVLDAQNTARIMAAATVRVPDTSKLLDGVHDLSDRIRQQLGETRDPVHASSPRLEPVTTSSLRALQLYTAGMRAVNQRDWAVAAELLQQAVAVDADFGSAQIYLAHCLHNLGRPADEYLGHARAAMRVAGQTSDRERYFILGSAYQLTGETDKAAAAYETLLQLYPDDFWCTNNLAALYRDLNRRADAWPLLIRLAALRPNDLNVTVEAAIAARESGRDLVEVNALITRARNLALTTGAPRQMAFLDFFPVFTAWVNADVRNVSRQVDLLQNKSHEHSHLAGMFNLALGRLAAADRDFEHAQPEGNRHAYLALTALLRRDRGRLTTEAGEAARHLSDQVPLVAWLLFESGQMDTLRSYFSQQYLRHPVRADNPDARAIRTELRLMTQYDSAAIDEVDRSRRQLLPGLGWSLRIALIEADMLQRHGDLMRATAVLEDASVPRSSVNLSNGAFAGIFWLRVRAALAAAYRGTGRQDEAARIDSELRTLLAYADADFHLLP